MRIDVDCLAVRKNRYIILPVDFEEAWKVCCLALFGAHHREGYKSLTRLFSFPPPSSKQSRGPTILSNSVSDLLT